MAILDIPKRQYAALKALASLSSFENITLSDFKCCSDRTDHLPHGGYNCIAFAAGETDKWWWPAKRFPKDNFWPAHLPREEYYCETLENFIRAFETKGYKICKNGKLEKGIEKVVIYARSPNNPTHAARQLESGIWASKCGKMEDIEHESLSVLQGRLYGQVAVFMRRRRDGKPLMETGIRAFFKRLFGAA